MTAREFDIVIIGAGPSGSVAAAYLQRQNCRVLVLEKGIFPRFSIGESLLPRSMDHFEEVGLLDCVKAKGFEVKRGARFIRKDEVCHFDFSKQYGDGWAWTWQVPRADFDKTLTDELEARGVPVEFGAEVVQVDFPVGEMAMLRYKDGSEQEQAVKAKFVIDSSGYGRVLPRLMKMDIPSQLPEFSSVFVHVEDSQRPEGTEGTIITFDVLSLKCWMWVIPFSNGNCSLGFVGPTEWINSFSDNANKAMREMIQLSDHFKARFERAEFLFDTVKIQNYACNVSQIHGPGFALTGNSAEFLDPIFSSGVAFATESGLLAAKLAWRQIQGEPVDWNEEYEKHVRKGVNVFRSYVEEWYTGNLQTLFYQRPENPGVKRKICAVLAGYVWDRSNPFVRSHSSIIRTVADFVTDDQQ